MKPGDPEAVRGGSGGGSTPGPAAAAPSFSPPSLALPKGGGAIRGIGEKFAANPVTGTGSMNVPLATSPGRSGFGPELSLSYDSGSGNGPFGLGWTLGLPSITRKTDKGLPRYLDAEESDVFILSGAEDLVPVPDHPPPVPGFSIRRYRPRIEGLFARIERWTETESGDVHWRSISRDNILTLYGKDASSRIFDPGDPRHIFSWLICETRDDKGNAVLYSYKAEDGAGVDLAHAHERNRGGLNDLRRQANRHLKRVQYGNRVPLLDGTGQRPRFLTTEQIRTAGWMFEVVLDYGEHHADAPKPGDAGAWDYRNDPFSSYRSGFEVRTCRLCQRVLMFHHFADEAEVGTDCLVRSTDLTYSHEQDPANARNPIYSVLRAVAQTGYRRQGSGYLKRSLPPVEFEYTQPVVQERVEDIDAASLENLPIGVDGSSYQWTDLHGEGIPGILTEQADAWFYKRNISPISERPVEFAPLELVATRPNLALAGGQAQFMDLAGDGQPDLVVLDGPMPGLYEHDGGDGWQPFRPFTSRLNRDTRDPNLKFVDLDGDGHADVLISEDDAFVWHPSLAEEGFGPARRVHQALDEEKGPRLVFADREQSIHLADLSGDGLTDLVRIRNGEVCYWPNLGYGRFGAKITMDHAPQFDNPDQFEPKRLRLADIDGSGTTDIIYLHRDGVRLYFNQSGNGWSAPQPLRVFPRVDDLVAIAPTDLLGNGTACLVWSSPLPGDAGRQMRYVDLMGGQKPHLLVKTINNLGAETRVHYASSTKFYLADKRAGKPWITRLPFPVHVVERVETFDRVSGNFFVTRHAYHHGYFDGVERELRGFGMVEQWDTEEFAALTGDGTLPEATNLDAASHVPPVLTRTWFHTGVHLGRDRVSNLYAEEYYREPGLTDAEAKARLLDDTVLPGGLTLEEEREACRALKGSMLRQEVYTRDKTTRQEHPYTVTEQSFTIQRLQPKAGNRHAVFFTHARESLSYHYERNPADPRIAHALALEVDEFGNVRKSAAVGYGRRHPDPALATGDQELLVTCTENDFTNPVETIAGHRTPLPCEERTFELTGLAKDRSRFTFGEVLTAVAGAASIDYERNPTAGTLQKRLIEQTRTLYRRDDLSGPLPLRNLESRALPFESYKLAFTPGLVTQVYGARITGAMLVGDGRYVHSEGDAKWWIPSGRAFYSPDSGDSPAAELTYALAHFFLPLRMRDPFHTDLVSTETFVRYDKHDLLLEETRDALENRTTVGERDLDPTKPLVRRGQDYRVLQPALLMDPNRNRSAVAFDALGMVAGTAVMGKPEERPVPGDQLTAWFSADLTQTQIDQFFADPKGTIAATLLGDATTRIVYDLKKLPALAATLARETHASEPAPAGGLKIQVSVSYSDGFGREIQKKIQAEPGPVPQRDSAGKIVVGPDGQPVMTATDVSPRWVGSGWTVFNNKGKPVRQYEPFFTDTHRFEFDVRIGVSPVLFYDPVERVVATLHPNHTWEKVVFDAWKQETWDVNDTVVKFDPVTSAVTVFDPKTDADIGDFFRRLADADYLPTWHALRTDAAHAAAFAARYPDPTDRTKERQAAEKTQVHAATSTVAHFDALGRTFLTIAHNKFKRSDEPPTEERHSTRIRLDIEGNQREVRDANGRAVMRYDYDMLGNRIHQASMEAGERWTLNDVAGKPLYAWDSRDHRFRTAYDPLRRPADSFLKPGAGAELRIGSTVYGESRTNPEAKNLRGKTVEVSDQAGVVTTDDYDFKGNLLRSSRQLAQEYKATLDWLTAVPLEAETYTSRTRYDALSRPIELTTPDNSVIRHAYNEANLLERIEANLRGAAAATPFVTDIDYDAKGQRTLIDHGNNVRTTYTYDPLTFRLVHLKTRRNAAGFDGTDRPGEVQNLHYTYDPAGNITHIRDDAQQTVFFRNRRVEPSAEYTYDAIYRLIEATGREHLGTGASGPTVPDAFNGFHTRLDHPGDGNAMGIYLEQYVYDAVGNILSMQHRGKDPAHPGWKREYAYNETSQLENSKKNNRLSSTTVGATTEAYRYDGSAGLHGNITAMPHLPLMQWAYRDQLQATARQAAGGGVIPETTWYIYDAGGQRVRKVTEGEATAPATPVRKAERIYLGGFEVHREYENDGTTVKLERETLHVIDDKQRIALVETRTQGNDGSPTQLIRYQLGNHLGSTSLELDDQAQIISYEEYYSYGSTSYQAVDKNIKAAAKRYRYTGKERDEESGFCYHGARYYAPWLGRWSSCDPAGMVDGPNLYVYSRNNPIRYMDPRGTVANEKPDAVTADKAAKIQASQDFQHYREIERVLRAPRDSLDLATGLRVLESSYTPDDPGQVSYRLKDLNPSPQPPRKGPPPDVVGIGPITEYSQPSGKLSILTFTGQAKIDDDGSGPSHDDPAHQTQLGSGKNINADEVPYVVVSMSLLRQLGNDTLEGGLKELPYGSIALVERGGNVFPAVIEDAGNYDEAGEVSVKLGQQIRNLGGFRPQKGPYDLGAKDVSYHLFPAGPTPPVTKDFTIKNITAQARAVLIDRLQRRADELFQRALGTP